MKVTTRNLADGSILTVTVNEENEYDSFITPSQNLGFEYSHGVVARGETLENIADELRNYLNLNS